MTVQFFVLMFSVTLVTFLAAHLMGQVWQEDDLAGTSWRSIPRGNRLPPDPSGYEIFMVIGSEEPYVPDGIYYSNGSHWVPV